MEFGGLKVLMISTDRNIFTPESSVSLRMKEYGQLVEELHIVVMSDSAHELKKTQIDKNIWVYPTNSFLKYLRPYSAASLGKKIVFERKFVRGKSLITVQDPFECGLAGLKVKNKWRLPLEVQLHTDPFSSYFSGFINMLRKCIAKKVLRRADSLRVVSESLAEKISEKFHFDKGKIFVLPIYLDIKKMEEGHITFDLHVRYGWSFVMLAVSRLTEEKNIEAMLRVLAKLKSYFHDAGLVIVGDGPLRGRLESLSTTLGISSNVVFVGWQEDTSTYYRTANLFIQTSHFEGYGLSLIEAGLSGLPVVTTPVGIATELENGVDAVICPHNDEEYMFKAVYDLIKNNGSREMMRMHLKRTLETKLITKEAFLLKLSDNWSKTASNIHT